MPSPVCVPCLRFFKRLRNGITIEEGMPIRQADGSDGWQRYKLWHADHWKCDRCGHELVIGFGNQPIGEHYEPRYRELVTTAPHYLGRVDDCPGPYRGE